MHLPFLKPPEQSVEMISQFGGYNHKLSIGESEFFDMKNMSAKDFPLAATRQKRGTLKIGGSSYIENAKGIVAENKLLIPYIGKGDIGVEVKQNVEAKNAVSFEECYNAETSELTIDRETNEKYTSAALIDGELYTKICGFRDSAIINEIKKDISNTTFVKSKFKDGNIQKVASGFAPIVKDSGLYRKYPHESIEAGLLWTITLFDVNYVHIRSESGILNTLGKMIVSVNENEFLANEIIRNSLVGAEIYVGKNEWRKANILSVEKLENAKGLLNNKFWGYSKENNVHLERHGDWTITIENPTKEEGTIKEGDTFIVALTDALATSITERKDEKWIYRKLNPPTEVAVEAKTPTHLQVLLGKTVNFSGDDIYVSGIDTTDGAQKIYLDLPHGAITEGSTIEGDRLFITEFDPETGETVTSDIFAAAEGEHRFVEMGANLVIFPEKVVVNTLKKNDDGQLNDIQTLELTNIIHGFAFQLCDVDGNHYSYEENSISNTAPSSPSDGTAWIDTSTEPPKLKVWSEQTAQWAVTEPYCEIYTNPGLDFDYISDVWQVGDALEIEGADPLMNPKKDQKYFVVSAVGTRTFSNNKTKKYIRIPLMVRGQEQYAKEATERIILKRTMPEMDFVIENKNRLWGCKYGLVDGEMINEIFACKLGDPKNWHHFTNTAIDSYYVTMGENGAFTGAISYKDNPIFFREDCMHRILGDYPAAFGMHVIDCHGVEAGSDKSLTVMNDVLFYKSPVGIMAFTGATPVIISDCFGNEKYKNAVACSLGNKMFFSMADSKNQKSHFVFDDVTKLWHKEDNLAVKDFAVYGGEIYSLTDEDSLISMHGVYGTAEDDFEWFLESGKIGFMTPFRKRISKVTLRLLMELDTRASISIQYDSSGHFEHISTLKPAGKVRSIAVPIMPRRCDHFALKIEGRGALKILSVTKYTEEGSDYE